jgi:hypothetical protein
VSKDVINHPAHYTHGKFEPIDVIEDWDLGFCLGNTVKYIARAGHKDPAKEIEDLKKAAWYLARHIKTLELLAELEAVAKGKSSDLVNLAARSST